MANAGIARSLHPDEYSAPVRVVSASTKVLIVLISLGAIILLFWAVIELVIPVLPQVGSTVTGTVIELPGWIQSGVKIFFNVTPPITLENLLIHLAVFFIVLFALGDIVGMFSAFSPTTSWVIAAGLALIAGLSQFYGAIVKIFGLTATLGALGIAVIIFTAIFAAVIFHVGVGKSLQMWAWRRQAALEELKTAKGATGVASAIRGLKDVNKAFKEGEK